MQVTNGVSIYTKQNLTELQKADKYIIMIGNLTIIISEQENKHSAKDVENLSHSLNQTHLIDNCQSCNISPVRAEYFIQVHTEFYKDQLYSRQRK